MSTRKENKKELDVRKGSTSSKGLLSEKTIERGGKLEKATRSFHSS